MTYPLTETEAHEFEGCLGQPTVCGWCDYPEASDAHLRGDEGPANDDWIHQAYLNQHPKQQPDTFTGLVGR